MLVKQSAFVIDPNDFAMLTESLVETEVHQHELIRKYHRQGRRVKEQTALDNADAAHALIQRLRDVTYSATA